MRVLDIIESLSPGGACRSAIALARYSRVPGELEFRMLGLTAPDRRALELAHQAGITLVDGRDPGHVEQEIRAADVVQVHFWNNPALYEFLERAMPPARLLVRCHVAGTAPPQMLPPALVDYSDMLVVTSTLTLTSEAFRESVEGAGDRVRQHPDCADLARVAGLQPRPHSGFNVGYIGTLDFSKMHRDFVAMHALPGIGDLRVTVCGTGPATAVLRRDVQQRGLARQFDFPGYVDDVPGFLQQLDVFGYPLAAGNYSTSELVLQEVMAAGIPPVVLPHGGAGQLVDDGVTGIVADDPDAYREAIVKLHRDAGLRHRLGAAARHKALDSFGAANHAAGFREIFHDICRLPKRPRAGLSLAREPVTIHAADHGSGSARFLAALVGAGTDFVASRYSANPEQLLTAESRIATNSTDLGDAAAGVILAYRRHYPSDPWLQLWTGLLLEGGGQNALALAAYHEALGSGLDHWRVHGYLARSAGRLGAKEIAAASRRRVVREAGELYGRLGIGG